MDKSVNKNISSDEIMQFFNDNGLTEEMNKIKSDIIRRIDILGERITEHTGHPSIDHIVSRVKSPESIIRKLKRENVIPIYIDDLCLFLLKIILLYNLFFRHFYLYHMIHFRLHIKIPTNMLYLLYQ